MIKKITHQIYQLTVPIPYDFGEVNCYLIEGENGFTIVDTGSCTEETKEVWKKVLSELSVEKLVITHSHPDHIGLAGWLQQKFGIPVWLSKKGYDEMLYIRSLFTDKKYSDPLSDFMLLHGGPDTPQKRDDKYFKYETYHFEPDMFFEENEEIKIGNGLYETIWTPGHSPDHFCYYDRKNEILIVGDHILNSMNPVVLAKKPGDNPLSGYFKTFEKLITCKVKHVLTGHGEQIEDLQERIKDLKLHYEKRWQQILKSVQGERGTAFEITKKIYGNAMSKERLMTAFMQTITNLIYLESEGIIEEKEIDGKLFFIGKLD